MRMSRRSTKVQGLVNFPVHTESTNEGGMYVRLWAVPKNGAGLCCGTETREHVDGVFLGTDTTKKALKRNETKMQALWAEPIKNARHVDRLMKLEKELDDDIFGRFCYEDQNKVRWSCPLAVSVLLGSTGWSNSSFICTYDDLNEEGKSLYDLFKRQYPHCKLHLLTFLDT